MSLLPFATSKQCSIGVELELQIIDSSTYDLSNCLNEVLDQVEKIPHPGIVKPEITRNTIELNTSVHDSIASLQAELTEMKACLIARAPELAVRFCGGGTHAFLQTHDNELYLTPRYKKVSEMYGYLIKHFTLFGQHIHVGCASAQDAIYLTHAFSRYLPQLVALSASSPFYQGVDTTFDSSRLNILNTFPTSGYIPYVHDWPQFCSYFEKMCRLGIVESMKDFYWDVRPKPEFGTVELRMFDTPLTLECAVMLAAYVQALSLYLLTEKPFSLNPELYLLYAYNRFQAARFGFNGDFINPQTEQHVKIQTDILETISLIMPYAEQLGSMAWLMEVMMKTQAEQNDAKWLRDTFTKVGSLTELVYAQSQLWMGY